MGSRRQKAARRRRATQHAQRVKPALPEGWNRVSAWLGWTRITVSTCATATSSWTASPLG